MRTPEANSQRDVLAERVRLLGGIRAVGADYADFTRSFASWLGLHPTDAAALVEILFAEDSGTPLSPARLSDRIGLTSGATTAALNRLERAGHVVRSREHTDRRVVTLRTSNDIQGPAVQFFATLGRHLDALLASYSPSQLTQVNTFLDELHTTMTRALAEGVPPLDRQRRQPAAAEPPHGHQDPEPPGGQL